MAFTMRAGDDTQRQLGSVPHVKPSKVYRIMLTSLTPDCLLGLPGLLCTCNASRWVVWGGHGDPMRVAIACGVSGGISHFMVR